MQVEGKNSVSQRTKQSATSEWRWLTRDRNTGCSADDGQRNQLKKSWSPAKKRNCNLDLTNVTSAFHCIFIALSAVRSLFILLFLSLFPPLSFVSLVKVDLMRPAFHMATLRWTRLVLLWILFHRFFLFLVILLTISAILLLAFQRVVNNLFLRDVRPRELCFTIIKNNFRVLTAHVLNAANDKVYYNVQYIINLRKKTVFISTSLCFVSIWFPTCNMDLITCQLNSTKSKNKNILQNKQKQTLPCQIHFHFFLSQSTAVVTSPLLQAFILFGTSTLHITFLWSSCVRRRDGYRLGL